LFRSKECIRLTILQAEIRHGMSLGKGFKSAVEKSTKAAKHKSIILTRIQKKYLTLKIVALSLPHRKTLVSLAMNPHLIITYLLTAHSKYVFSSNIYCTSIYKYILYISIHILYLLYLNEVCFS